MTSITLPESPDSLQCRAWTMEGITVSRAEPCTLQNCGTGSCRMVKDSRRGWWRGPWAFSAGNTRKTEGISSSSSSLLCRTGVTSGQLRPGGTSICFLCIFTSFIHIYYCLEEMSSHSRQR